MPTAAYRALYNLAEDQMGYVTTAHAAAVGVRPMTLVMMTKRGALERVSRGVYRLVDFPVQPLTQYMQATLWPYERPGVLSHATALSLYELSDADPAKVHITIPADFRVQRQIPEYLVVHRGELAREDVTRLEGMPITTPARTIRDCIEAHLGPALLNQAIDEARHAGMLGATVAADLEREIRVALSGEGGAANAPAHAAPRARSGGTSRRREAKAR
jgi:predicted transcriptional regulator of viral defense system